jgi:hypothetical protein
MGMASRVAIIALLSSALCLVQCGGQRGGPGTAKAVIGMACSAPASAYVKNINLYRQKAANWCWAASGEMAMQSKGRDVQQCQQAADEFRTDCCCPDPAATNCGKYATLACNQGGWPQFEKYQFAERHTCRRAIPWEQLKEQIACKNSPVVFSWLWGETDYRPPDDTACTQGGTGHMMVARGYTEGNGEQLVFVYDPGGTYTQSIPYSEYAGNDVDHHHWNDYYDIGTSEGK